MSADAELMLPCGKLMSACAELIFACGEVKVNFPTRFYVKINAPTFIGKRVCLYFFILDILFDRLEGFFAYDVLDLAGVLCGGLAVDSEGDEEPR